MTSTRSPAPAPESCSFRSVAYREWVYKSSSGFEEEPDENLDAWSGLLPFTYGFGEPMRAPWNTVEIPESVRRLTEQGPARGR